jgi:ferredoxin-nitrate reductase
MTKVKSTCSYCGVGCGVEIEKRRDGSLSLVGNVDYPSNEGRLCSKGMNLHHVVMDQKDRILEPRMRTAKHHSFQKVSWDRAMARASAVFRKTIEKYGPNSVGLYVSGQLLTEEYYIANKLCKGFLGTNNIDTNSRLCMSSAVVGYKKTIGEDAPPISYADIEASDLYLVSGANPAWCHPILFRRMEARLQEDEGSRAKMIVIDPRKTQTAEMADIHLQLLPGSDVPLNNALAKLLVEGDFADDAFLGAHVEGWLELKSFLEKLDLDEASKACGVEISQIKAAADLIGKSRGLLSFWAMGLNQSAMAVDKNLSLINLSLITGRIGRPGCGPFSLTGQPNAMGGREVGGLANMLAAHRELHVEKHREEVARVWNIDPAVIQDKPGLTATQMVEAIESGSLKALWVMCTNPVVSWPDLPRVEKALNKIPFLMVSDISEKSDTLDFADLVLPAAGWSEKEGTMTNSERRISYLPKLMDAPGKALCDSEIMIRFAKAMGFGEAFDYQVAEEVFNEHRELTKGTNIDISGVSYDRLKKGSLQWPCPSEDHPGTERLFGDGQFWTPSGKAQLHCVEHEYRSEHLSEEYPFALTTGRIRDQWHTMTRTGKVNKLWQQYPEPFCELNDVDAEKMGVEDGDIVHVYNERGEVKVKAKVGAETRSGTVFLPMHWGKLNNGSRLGRANNLTSLLVDPISKEPDFKFSAVNVEKVTRQVRTLVLIGGGAASLEFIHQYREKNKDDRIVIFGKEPHLFYNRILLPDYINDDKDWSSMLLSEEEELARLGVTFHCGVAIDKIDRDAQRVLDAKGNWHAYDKLLMATGSRPMVSLPVSKAQEGVFGLRTRHDADAIRSYVDAGDAVAIIGGGLLGLELAGSLSSMGVDVTILQRSSKLMRGQLDDLGSKLLHEEILDRGIKVIYDDQVSEIVSDGNLLKGVILKTGRVLKLKALFFAAGIRPNIELGVEAGLKSRKGLIVDHQMRTSDPNIYAMGEVAEHQGRLYGTTPAAQDQAKVVSAALLGDIGAAYEGSLSFNVLKIKDLELASIGQVQRSEGDGIEEVTLIDEKVHYYKKCLIKNDRLVGAILIGNKSEFNSFKMLIESGVELGDQRASLLKGGEEEKEPPIGPVVCSCHNVGAGNLDKLMKEGCDSFDELCQKSCAGTGCGSCRPEVKRIFENFENTGHEVTT